MFVRDILLPASIRYNDKNNPQMVRNMTNIIRKLASLYRKKIFFKIFLLLLLATSVPAVILTMISQQRTRDLVQSEFIAYKETLNEQISKNIDENMRSMEKESEALVYNIADIQRYLSYRPDTVDENYYDAANQVNNFFTSILSNNDRFDGIGLMAMDGSIASYVNSQGFSPKENSGMKLPRLQEAIASNGSAVITQIDLDQTMKSSYFNHKNNHVIGVMRLLVDYKTENKPIGVSLFTQELTKFGEVVTHGQIGEEDTVIILADDNVTVFSNQEELPESFEQLQQLAEKSKHEEGPGQTSFHWNGQYVIYDDASDFNFKVITFIPEEVITRKLEDVRQINAVLMTVLALSAVILSVLLSNFITSPLIRLQLSFKRFQTGDFSYKAEVKGEDEFAEIQQGFNTMVENVNVLIQEKYEIEWSRRHSEMESLQSKINPHFLYNTLSSIKAVIQDDNAETARQMVQDLSELFRYSLSKGKHIVPLAEELAQVRKYLTLQKLRFGDSFQVHFDVDADMMSANILRLTIQPIVENAILHGLEDKSGERQIHIFAQPYGNELRIYVEDNGKGMTNSQTDEINAMLCEDPRKTRDLVGIYNVNSRIKLYYGSEYGLHVQSAPNEGTIVKVVLPLNGGINR